MGDDALAGIGGRARAFGRRAWRFEETGEAAEAFIGLRGFNARKGVCRTREDLLAELADVIITAA